MQTAHQEGPQNSLNPPSRPKKRVDFPRIISICPPCLTLTLIFSAIFPSFLQRNIMERVFVKYDGFALFWGHSTQHLLVFAISHAKNAILSTISTQDALGRPRMANTWDQQNLRQPRARATRQHLAFNLKRPLIYLSAFRVEYYVVLKVLISTHVTISTMLASRTHHTHTSKFYNAKKIQF